MQHQEDNRAVPAQRRNSFPLPGGDVERWISEGWQALRSGDAATARDSLRTAAALARADNIPALEGRILARVALACEYLGDLDESIRVTSTAVELLSQGGPACAEEHVAAVSSLGYRLLVARRFDEAGVRTRQAVELARLIPQGNGDLAHALINHGNLLMALDRLDEAGEAYREALMRFEATGDEHGAACARVSLGNVCLRERRVEEARTLYERVLAAAWVDPQAIRPSGASLPSLPSDPAQEGSDDRGGAPSNPPSRSVPDEEGESGHSTPTGRDRRLQWMTANDARMNLGRLEYDCGNLQEALRCFVMVMEEAEQRGHRERLAQAAFDVGLIHDRLDAPDAAATAYGVAAEIVRASGPPDRALRIRRNQLTALRRGSRPGDVLRSSREALRLARSLNDLEAVLEILDNLAIVHLRLGAADRAIDYWENVLRLGRRIGLREREENVLRNLSHILASRGRPDLALVHAEELVDVCAAGGLVSQEGWALLDLGTLLVLCDGPRDAQEKLRRAETLAEQVADTLLSGLVHSTLGSLAIAAGDALSAVELYDQAAQDLERASDADAAAANLENLALALEMTGHPVRAHRCRLVAERLRTDADAGLTRA